MRFRSTVIISLLRLCLSFCIAFSSFALPLDALQQARAQAAQATQSTAGGESLHNQGESILSSFAPFPSPGLQPLQPLVNQNSNLVAITQNGFEPAIVDLFGPGEVTWSNTTTTTQVIRGGGPVSKLYMPLISQGIPSVQAATQQTTRAPDVTYLRQEVDLNSFEATVGPGETFTYRFITPGNYTFHLDGLAQFTGEVSLTGTTVLETSPASGESGVATTRETIIDFSGPLDPASVTPAAFQAKQGDSDLPFRLQLSADKQRVTLFYNESLPGNAQVSVHIDGEQLRDAQGILVDVNGSGIAGGAGVLTFDTLSLTVVPGTSVCGRVFASELAVNSSNVSLNTPLGGVTITVDGAEDMLRTTTDSSGNFCLDPAPAGRFFVHIDGRTATNGVPNGAYYPFVGKAWVSVPEQETNIGDVFLPLIAPGTLQDVSNDEDTIVTFPQSVLDTNPNFADVSVLVPADSLYSDDGTRGGKVGIAPVAPDRLPGQLPEGLNFPLVITVQTDGATNFDEPAPVCFPNLPDPDTNELLGPGDKSTLWSFNHDSGRFEPMGGMTVSVDGKLVCSDPGVGILAPGWHGADPFSWLQDLLNWINAQCNPTNPSVCAGAIAGAWLDCLFSFTPAGPAACAIGVAIGMASVAQACQGQFNNPNQNPSLACMQALAGLSLSIASCFGRAIPGLGSILACGGGLLSVMGACNCGGRVNAAGQYEIYDPDGALSPDAQAKLQAHLDVLQSLKDFYELYFGSDVWVNAVGRDGNLLAIEQEVQTILDAWTAAGEDGSDGGARITNTEATSIRALPRPDTISASDVDALINYWNNTVDQWAQGITTHAQAGRTDFIDLDKVVAGSTAIEQAINGLAAVGATEINFKQALVDAADTMATGPMSANTLAAAGPIYFALEDENTGLIQRGQVGSNGGLGLGGVRADTLHRISLYAPTTNSYGSNSFVTSGAGTPTRLPHTVLFMADGAPDRDNDGLIDDAEAVIGTDPDKADTDGDGVLDGAEVALGNDALSGTQNRTGILASVDTPGLALDICVDNDLAAVADNDSGVALFNVFNINNPLLVAQEAGVSAAQRVACSAGHVAAATTSNGLVILDVRDVSNIQTRHQIDLGDAVKAVALTPMRAYAITDSGRLVAVDMQNGQILGDEMVPGTPHDLVVAGDYLYILTQEFLYPAYITGQPTGVQLIRYAGLRVEGFVTLGGRPWRLFVGDDVAYITHNRGYNTVDISIPALPRTIANGNTEQLGWKQLVATGTGQGMAAVGANSTNDGLHHVSLYDISDPQQTNAFVAQFGTPGIASALTLDKGLVYVADRAAGMQVINYLAPDTQGNAPTIALTSSFDNGRAQPNAPMRLTANVADDVQVRAVTFTLNGQTVGVDGSYPFELRWTTPNDTLGTTFIARAKATDTGGNETWSDEITFTYVADAIPPQLAGMVPLADTNNSEGAITVVQASFTEPLDGATINTNTFQLFTPGPDDQWETSDDTLVAGGTIAFDAATNMATLSFASPLPQSPYRVVLSNAVTDLAGNALPTAYSWHFVVGQKLQLGDVINDGIDEAGEVDRYYFDVVAGQRVFVDVQTFAPALRLMPYKILDAQDTEVASSILGGSEIGAVEFASGGTYAIVVGAADRTAQGAYQIQLWDVPLPEQFAITIGDTVSNGMPSAGAGNIESPGREDIYTFQANAGQQIYADLQSFSGIPQVKWRIEDGLGNELANTCLGCTEPGVLTLTQGGTYTITVGSLGQSQFGTYQFTIWDVPPPQQFAIAIGDTVSNGVPGAGAGNIESPGVQDIYTFSATAGQQVSVNFQAGSTILQVRWVLRDPAGEELAATCVGCSNPGAITLPQDGTYTITVGSSRVDQIGTYQFQLMAE